MIRGAILVAAALMTGPVRADGPPPFPEFTFKRVAPPAAGTTRRITVQIDPVAQTAPARVVLSDPTTEPGSVYPEFWASLPVPEPGMGTVRLEAGLNALDTTDVRAPRLADLSGIANMYGSDILLATIGTEISPALVLAVISVESSGKADAVSRAGATGLMQLMPATAERFGVEDATVAADNIRAGVEYLDWLLAEFDDPVLALAGYNAGENSVRRTGDVPNYPETRAYVPKVLAAWSVARGLCRTRPELISDGCVFVSGGGA